MALDGPTNKEIYQEIFDTKDASKKQLMMKALTATQKREYMQFLQLTKLTMEAKELKSTISSLSEREAALRSEDRTILHQASSSYAPNVGSVQVHTGPTSDSTPRHGSKFSQ